MPVRLGSKQKEAKETLACPFHLAQRLDQNLEGSRSGFSSLSSRMNANTHVLPPERKTQVVGAGIEVHSVLPELFHFVWSY